MMIPSNLRAMLVILAVAASALVAGQARPDPNIKESAMQPTTQPKHTNRLIDATSPYLLQHAHNPIDWYEWGEEAFKKAQAEDKPIFLSIGYSACHWCHVMEHETFEDEQVAEFLNQHIVCIKVDREERPDVDEIYMHVTQLMNQGNGGWPMSVFLTPDRRPIFAATYIPRDQFLSLSGQIHNVWNQQRDQLEEQGRRLQEILADWAKGPDAAEAVVAADVPDRAAVLLARYFDQSRGGLQSDNNKFPPSMAMDLMLRVHHRTRDANLLQAVEVTLDNMAYGGIYDHLGGGICRYSTDPDWLVPHFEKMLYDQALVSAIYIDAWLVTRKPLYDQIVRDIFEYVLGDLQSPEGGFYSTRDADSEGLEGAFYIWTVQQVHEVLGAEDGALFCKFYDVTDTGNWFESRGHAPAGPKNILHVTKPPEVFAKLHSLTLEQLDQKLELWRTRMLAARAKRVPPALDDKVLTAWNGLMIASLAKGAAALDEPRYALAAARAADFVLTRMRKDGRLLRTWRQGAARLTGYLSDYAFLVEGLLNLYEATGDRRWLDEAIELTDTMIEHYYDEAGGAFFFTADDAEELLARTKNPRDGAIPSGNSVAAMNLVRLARLLDRKDYQAKAESIFRAFSEQVGQSPAAFERLLCALDFYHQRTREIAVVGDLAAPNTKVLVRTVFDRYLPNKVVALSDGSAESGEGIALLREKTAKDGSATAYVCENFVCKKPVITPEELAPLLEAAQSANSATRSGR